MKSVLIVDADRHASAIAAAETSRAGYEPHISSCAADAIRQAPSLHAEFYLIEVKLSDGLGYEVTRAIRKHPRLYRAEVLLTSNSTEVRDIEYGLHEGADAYLRKPFSAVEFSSKLQALSRLHVQVETRCPLTGFESVQSLRREVDHLIFREQDFALCYLIPKGLSRLRAAHKNEEVNAAARATAQVIHDTIRNESFYETHAGYLGSGHFVVMVTTDDWKRFHSSVARRYAAAYAGGRGESPLPEPTLRFGAVLSNDHHRYAHSRDMLHDLQSSPLCDGSEAPSERSGRLHVHKKPTGHEHWAG